MSVTLARRIKMAEAAARALLCDRPVRIVLVRRIVEPGELDPLPATVREAVPCHLDGPVQRRPDESYDDLIDRTLSLMPAHVGVVRLIAE